VSPTQRTLKHLRDQGWTAVVVASWNAFSKTRRDVWTADILAYRDGNVLLVNATDATSVSKRLAKAQASPEAQGWCGGELRRCGFAVMGWKKGVRGPDALVWREL